MEHSVGGIDSTGKQQVRRGWEIFHVTCFAMWISIGWEMMPWKKARICCEALCEAILFNANGFVQK